MQAQDKTNHAFFMDLEEISILETSLGAFVTDESNPMREREKADAMRSKFSIVFWGKDLFRPLTDRCDVHGCFYGPHTRGEELCPLHLEGLEEIKNEMEES
jgi:hypothetical protein